MKKILSLFAVAWLLSLGALQAQDVGVYRLDATTNGTTLSLAAEGGAVTLRDDDSQGQGAPDAGYPMSGIDYSITIEGNCTGENRLAIRVGELSVHCLDTLYIYDGPNTSSPLIKKFNWYDGGVREGDLIFVTPTNATNMVTIRFRTDDLSDPQRTALPCFENSDGVGKGFSLNIHCAKPCEEGEPVIDEVFYRTRNGVVYDSARIHEVTLLDTVWVDEDDPSQGFHGVDTVRFLGAHLCIGDGVIFRGHGQYSNHNYGYYTPNDAQTYFHWDMGNENDTVDGVGVTQVEYDEYQNTGCYDVSLTMVDGFGCASGVIASVKVRTAFNPLKTIFTIGDICNNAERLVSMGYDGDNATLTLRKIEASQVVSKTYEALTFVPDGCNCSNNPAFATDYFEAPVTFTEFPNNRRISSAKDICSICVNMEHSYMGDFTLTIVCPTGQEAILKFGSPSSCSPTGIFARASDDPTYVAPNNNGGSTGGGTFFGYPTETGNEAKCDPPTLNPYGIGLDYCFSRDTAYTLITGQNAAAVWTPTVYRPAGQFYIGDNHGFNELPMSSAPPAQPMPATYTNPVTGVVSSWGSYAGQVPTLMSYGNTRKPSNHEEKTDYYLPYSTFQELVGCPLNGEWKMRVYDIFGSDNGWIFNWSLDICNVSQDQDCKYQVAIDSLVWRPRPGHEDYDLGRYRGLQVRRETPTISYLSSPDTAGYFPIDVFIYDEFGCIWDTATSITTYWAPEPDLGPDTTLCGVATMTLDARDRHSELPTENYTYLWNPFGQETSTIESSSDGEDVGDITYIVEVKNTRRNTVCTTRDTIFIRQRKQPYPSFISEPLSFEGCAPYTIAFNNVSTNADRHLWDFGDGITSEHDSPVHTYAEGIYTLKYYAISDDGCVDSVVSPNGVVVYPTPKANFIWEPVYPSVSHPIVQFTNTTQPHSGNSQYRWEFQYDRNNNLSVHTLTDRNPTFNYATYASDDGLSGNYAVRLIAFTDNLAPSGNRIQCRDTAENMILIINDFLQFPNVVTPNGDGINDRFVIINLLDGIGYPINQLDIYNRWGTRVYHKENISSDEDFWDPADLPAGTYFYRFSAKGYSGNIEHNGAIEVVK